ncbi:MAG: cyclic pyranopterin monophosphate synthase MoaC [Methanomassiliicoccales archaeon]
MEEIYGGKGRVALRKRETRMKDIGGKPHVERVAVAEGRIKLGKESLESIFQKTAEKGNVLAAAEIAGILAAKHTSSIIPLCHQVPLESVDVGFEKLNDGLKCTVRVATHWSTGVEMDALTGASAALLTVWDMIKEREKDTEGMYPNTSITDLRVVQKRKG